MIPGVFAAAARPGPRLWTPEDLASPPAFWVDRSSGVVIVGGRVAEWLDKGGNSWSALQSTGASRPEEFDTPWRVNFDGDDYMDITAAANDLFSGVTSAWLFTMFRREVPDNADVENGVLVWGTPDNTYRQGMNAGSVLGGDRLWYGGRRLDSEPYEGISTPGTVTGGWHMGLGLTNYATRTLALWLDGAEAATKSGAFTGAGATSNTASGRARVGSAVANDPLSPNATLNGDLRIAMAGVGLPDSGEIDRMFGWAAWEDPGLNLASLLPMNHPYRNAPPMV